MNTDIATGGSQSRSGYFRFGRLIISISLLVLLCLGVPLSGYCSTTTVPSTVVQVPAPERTALVSKADISYENSTLTEDVTWRGTVLIKGSVVIAPQATVRMEPGTLVLFEKSTLRQPPRLVVMGRIQCSGTAEKPVTFGPNLVDSRQGDWGGILLVSTEKRNQFDQVRIEGAETGIDARFSTLAGTGITVVGCGTGIGLKDSTAQLSEVSVSGCDMGLDIRDSEFDLRESRVFANRIGISGYHSSLALTSLMVRDNEQQGILAEECRMRCASSEISGNVIGALIKGGEGQVLLSRFLHNREVGLQSVGARLRINRTLFADNDRDGMRFEDGKSAIWSCSFSGNGGANIALSGRESLSAVLNWWDTSDEAAITSKISGPVIVAPWLTENPAVP